MFWLYFCMIMLLFNFSVYFGCLFSMSSLLFVVLLKMSVFSLVHFQSYFYSQGVYFKQAFPIWVLNWGGGKGRRTNSKRHSRKCSYCKLFPLGSACCSVLFYFSAQTKAQHFSPFSAVVWQSKIRLGRPHALLPGGSFLHKEKTSSSFLLPVQCWESGPVVWTPTSCGYV